jgi:hypothetical protein
MLTERGATVVGFDVNPAAHHRAAIPLATAAIHDAAPSVGRLASSMLVDQSIEAVSLERLAGEGGARATAIPYVCRLGVRPASSA